MDVADNATAADVAGSIGPRLAKNAVGAKITTNGETQLLDVHQPIPGDCAVQILTATDDDPDSLYVLRHSAAHIMAEAICKLYPDTKLVYGPPLEDGFYYDIDLDTSITPDDFERIEAEMQRIVKEKRPFTRYDLGLDEGMSKLRDEGSRYKIDNAERAGSDTLSFYVTGENQGECFEDLCRGPHLPSTSFVKAFKVQQVSRSFYRGEVNNQPLQRIYGTAFFKKSSLEEHLHRLEEAKKRDHRIIGRQLELFAITEKVGAGMALWLPKGTTIRTKLQDYLTEEMRKLGYEMIVTPHIGHLDLFRTSGHYPYYEDSQYPPVRFIRDTAKPLMKLLRDSRNGFVLPDEQVERNLVRQAGIKDSEYPWDEKNPLHRCAIAEALCAAGLEGMSSKEIAQFYAQGRDPGYLLKPMNCPMHIHVFASKPRSYRDLPVRLGEYGTVHRYEQSGELAGLTRVRSFTQDDAHLFCTNAQLAAELTATVKLTRQVLEILGLFDYRVRVSLRDPDSSKYVGSQENWQLSEAAILQAARDSGVDFSEEPGEAAFYGPKIDFVVKDCIGRSWQLGTVQVDYNLPERFELEYVGSDNAPHRPIMIHRAPFGSLERFVGILIEHFAGAFPLWLSPVQVGIAPISEKANTYAREILERLESAVPSYRFSTRQFFENHGLK